MTEGDGRVRILIVDDEPLARDSIRLVLEAMDDIEITGQATNAAEAVEAIRDTSPDVVLLDVHMPDADGFHVIDAIGADAMPVVVFVTAYDSHAIRAFDVHAIDYVLKPFEDERLIEAVDRATRWLRVEEPQRDDRLDKVVREVRSGGQPYATRIMVREGDRIRFVRVDSIDWVEAANNNVVLHVGDRRHRIRSTLKGLADQLDPTRFVRIHRSTIINLDRVREVQPWFGGDYIAILEDGRKLKVSRTYREELLRPLH
jgi:two-component system LytT family response regulator